MEVESSSRDDAEKQVNEFHEVRVMRWRGGWAARVPTPLIYTCATLAPRNPINSWQAGPWRRGAGRYRVLIKLLQLATRQRAVLGATFIVSGSGPIAYDADETAMKNALEATNTIGTVAVSKSAPDSQRGVTWTITFLTDIGDIPPLEPTSSLTGTNGYTSWLSEPILASSLCVAPTGLSTRWLTLKR